MIPTPENIAKMQKEKREQKKKKLATQAHSKVSNDLIENTIIKNNISALKTIYYLSTKFEELGLDKYQDDQILATQIDKRELLKFTDLKLDTLIKTVKQMQRTAITFYSVDVDGGKIITGMNLLPLYEIVPNKNTELNSVILR